MWVYRRVDPLAGWKLFFFFLPFGFNLWYLWMGLLAIPATTVGLLAGVIGLMFAAVLLVSSVTGIWQRLPLWALPGLGFWIGVINLVVVFLLASDVMGGLHRFLLRLFFGWPEGAFLAPFLNTFLGVCLIWLPALLLTGLVLLLAALVPALRPFYNQVSNDHSLVSLLLYCSLLALPLMGSDPYHGLQWFQLPGALIMAGGAWLFLRMERPFVRLAVLCEAFFLAQVLQAVGIYRLAPSQAYEVTVNSAKHWRYTLEPVVFAAFMMLVLCLPLAAQLLRRKTTSQTAAA